MKPKSGQKKRGNGTPQVSPTAMSYNGPIRFSEPRGSVDNDSVVILMLNSATLSSSASGTLTTVFDSQTQMAACADLTQYQLLYSEFRLLAIEIDYMPTQYINTTGGIIRDAIYCVQDRQSATALASVADALGYSSTLSVHQGGSPFTCAMKMSGPGESTWISTASSPAAADRLYVKLYSIGNTASVTLGTYLARVVVQFRNRK